MERIVLCERSQNGLSLNSENFEKIKHIKSFDPTLKVAIISIIGEKGSGKTTYTNLLIQNLRHNAASGWLEKVDINSKTKEEVEKLPGFPIFDDVEEIGNNSEISLWPEAFRIKKNHSEIMVLILHANYSDFDHRVPNKDSFDFLLALVSSRMVEVIGSENEFRYLDIYQELCNRKQRELACNSVVLVWRKTVASEEPREKTLSKLLTRKKSSLDVKYLKLKLFSIPVAEKPLQTSKSYKWGYLKLQPMMYNALSDCINTIANDEHIFPKTLDCNQSTLTAEDFFKHFEKCFSIVCLIFGLKLEVRNKKNDTIIEEKNVTDVVTIAPENEFATSNKISSLEQDVQSPPTPPVPPPMPLQSDVALRNPVKPDEPVTSAATPKIDQLPSAVPLQLNEALTDDLKPIQAVTNTAVPKNDRSLLLQEIESNPIAKLKPVGATKNTKSKVPENDGRVDIQVQMKEALKKKFSAARGDAEEDVSSDSEIRPEEWDEDP